MKNVSLLLICNFCHGWCRAPTGDCLLPHQRRTPERWLSHRTVGGTDTITAGENVPDKRGVCGSRGAKRRFASFLDAEKAVL
jgi:hypothetical protein